MQTHQSVKYRWWKLPIARRPLSFLFEPRPRRRPPLPAFHNAASVWRSWTAKQPAAKRACAGWITFIMTAGTASIKSSNRHDIWRDFGNDFESNDGFDGFHTSSFFWYLLSQNWSIIQATISLESSINFWYFLIARSSRKLSNRLILTLKVSKEHFRIRLRHS